MKLAVGADAVGLLLKDEIIPFLKKQRIYAGKQANTCGTVILQS